MMKTVLHSGQCHCGDITFEFECAPVMDMTICNCSMCDLSAYQHIFVPQTDLRFTSDEDDLRTYTFNTGEAKHLFCGRCGVKPLYIPRSHPDCYSVNYRCIAPGTMTVGETIHFDGQNWSANIEGLRQAT